MLTSRLATHHCTCIQLDRSTWQFILMCKSCECHDWRIRWVLSTSPLQSLPGHEKGMTRSPCEYYERNEWHKVGFQIVSMRFRKHRPSKSNIKSHSEAVAPLQERCFARFYPHDASSWAVTTIRRGAVGQKNWTLEMMWVSDASGDLVALWVQALQFLEALWGQETGSRRGDTEIGRRLKD